MILGLIIGGIIGLILGYIIAGVLKAGSDFDDQMERMKGK